MSQSKPWSDKELQILLDNYGKIPIYKIAKLINRCYPIVNKKVKELKLFPIKKGFYFKLSEEEIIKRCEKNNIKLIDKYIGINSPIRFLCPFCKKEFIAKPQHICYNKQRSCGCVNLGRRKGSKYISGKYFTIIKLTAKRTNREFSISIEYLEQLLIKQNFKCNLSKIPIVAGYKEKLQTASLDRIDSSKDYIEGNVQWVHKDINFMKQEYNQQYFIDLCKKIALNN